MNRTSIVTTPYQQTAMTVSYTTNTLNQYTAVGGTSRTHDANGNLTDDGTLKFTYDYKNQIVEIRKKSDNSVVAEYKYDPLGRRVEKNVTGTGVERYVLCTIDSGNALGNLGNVMATYDGSGNWKQSFVHNGDVDDIVMLEQKDVLDFDSDGNTTERTRSYYHQNALGSVMEITDANEATVASYRYTPYGQMTITRNGQTQATDPLGQHWGFTGRMSDEESGLWYYRARYYHAIRGRMLQRDPAGYEMGPSLYAYVNENPTTITDPSGLGPMSMLGTDATQPNGGGGAASWRGFRAPFRTPPRGPGYRANRPCPQGPRVRRVAAKTLRKRWEKANGKKWPKDPKTGRNQDAHHKKPLSDGGTNDASNIEPLPRDAHIRHHRQTGDFSRWGSRPARP